MMWLQKILSLLENLFYKRHQIILGKQETKIDPILLGAQVMSEYGSQITGFVRRDKTPDVTFSYSDKVDIAGAAGTQIFLNKEYFDKATNTEAKGILIHEVAHAIEQAEQGGEWWLIEALADFVRLQLGYGKSEWVKADPRISGYGGGAYFFQWLYLNKYHIYVIVVDAMNKGLLLNNINQMVDDYLLSSID